MTNEDDEKKVRMLAEATGRSEDDIRADLADDGVINESNRGQSDLVTQLKEAAELITTVQNINRKVSDNSVLNGGDNKTEVAVETTLEGDIVDRAIDSVERKMEKLKKIALMFAPVFLLIGGGGAYGLMDSSDDSDDTDYYNEDDDYYVVWGCTDWNADNYDEYATDDDGSCYYEQEDERHLDIQNHELSLVGDNELKVEFNLEMQGDFCCDDIELAWEIEVDGFYDDGLRRVTLHSYDEEGYIDFEEYWSDMGEGNYHARVEAKWMNEIWDEETTNGVTIEEPEPEPEPEPEDNCNGSFYEASHEWSNHTNGTANLTIIWDADWSCQEAQDIEIDLYLTNSTDEMVYMQIFTQTLNWDNRHTVQYTISNLTTNETYTVYLAIWVDKDGWRQDDEYQSEVEYP